VTGPAELDDLLSRMRKNILDNSYGSPEDPLADEDAVVDLLIGRITHPRMRLLAQTMRKNGLTAAPNAHKTMSAQQRVAQIANLLGACASCCGVDPSCTECSGSGKPGTCEPSAMMPAWIGFALTKLGYGLHSLPPSITNSD